MCLLNSNKWITPPSQNVTPIWTDPQEIQTVQQLVIISFLRADIKHLSHMEFMTILRPNPQARLFLNLRVFMLEHNWGQQRFLIPAYTRFSFDAGVACSIVFLHIMVNLELGRGNEMYLLLLYIVFGKLLFSPWSRHWEIVCLVQSGYPSKNW